MTEKNGFFFVNSISKSSRPQSLWPGSTRFLSLPFGPWAAKSGCGHQPAKSVWLPLWQAKRSACPTRWWVKPASTRPCKYRRFQCSPHCRGALGLSCSLSHPQSTHSFWLPGSPSVCGTTSSRCVCGVGGEQLHPHRLRRTRRLTGRHGLAWATAVC